MRRPSLWVLALLGLFFPSFAAGGGAGGTGIIKGTVTIDGRPTSEVVVSIEGLPQGNRQSQLSGLQSKHAVMGQRDLKFFPRVLPVLVGTTVDFPNDDKTFHNVFSPSEARKFDLGLYGPGKSRSVTFNKPGVVRILCNVHPGMEAYIVVKGQPYFTSPDRRGNYRLDSVPLGEYRLEVWHPDYGTRIVSFHLVREGEVLDINVDLKKQG